MIQLNEIRNKKNPLDVSLGFEEELEGKYLLVESVHSRDYVIYDAFSLHDILLITDNSKPNSTQVAGINIISRVSIMDSEYLTNSLNNELMEMFFPDQQLKYIFDSAEELKCFLNISSMGRVIPGSMFFLHEEFSLSQFLKGRKICFKTKDFELEERYEEELFNLYAKVYDIDFRDDTLELTLKNFVEENGKTYSDLYIRSEQYGTTTKYEKVKFEGRNRYFISMRFVVEDTDDV